MDWPLYREGGSASGEYLNIIEYPEAKTDGGTQLYSTDLLSETVQAHTNRDNTIKLFQITKNGDENTGISNIPSF